MDVKEAVAQAKGYLAQVFAGETISDIRLEEVGYDERECAWLITLGMVRPVNTGPLAASLRAERSYKVVRVPDDEHGRLSIRIREFAEE